MKNKKNSKKQIAIFAVVVVFAVSAFGAMIYSGARLIFTEKLAFFAKKGVEKCEAYRRLDGVCMIAGEKEKYPVAVMIDNKYEARPQSGLSYAGLVFEAPVEGGITRFLAVFTSAKEIKKIGPVRSIRPYYIDWAGEFEALTVHIGGSPAALEEIASDPDLRKRNIEENGGYIWRSSDRFAPHNAYTSSEKLDLARGNLAEGREAEFNAWAFKDDDPAEKRGDEKIIKIKFSNYADYDAVWEYDKEKNVYKRKLGENYMQDDGGRMVLAKNIAVLSTDIEVIDAVSRRKIASVGGGDALIFQDGKKIETRWKKDSREARLQFYDSDGQPVKFNRGTTWIEVVGDLEQVEEKI